VHVDMRVHRLDRESRARLPRVWVCVSSTPGEREQSGAAKVDRDNALRGGDAVLQTEDHGQEQGFPGDDERVGSEGLSSHEGWPQKGEALVLACVSVCWSAKGGVHVLT
jgi:hypothetical protein